MYLILALITVGAFLETMKDMLTHHWLSILICLAATLALAHRVVNHQLDESNVTDKGETV